MPKEEAYGHAETMGHSWTEPGAGGCAAGADGGCFWRRPEGCGRRWGRTAAPWCRSGGSPTPTRPRCMRGPVISLAVLGLIRRVPARLGHLEEHQWRRQLAAHRARAGRRRAATATSPERDGDQRRRPHRVRRGAWYGVTDGDRRPPTRASGAAPTAATAGIAARSRPARCRRWWCSTTPAAGWWPARRWQRAAAVLQRRRRHELEPGQRRQHLQPDQHLCPGRGQRLRGRRGVHRRQLAAGRLHQHRRDILAAGLHRHQPLRAVRADRRRPHGQPARLRHRRRRRASSAVARSSRPRTRGNRGLRWPTSRATVMPAPRRRARWRLTARAVSLPVSTCLLPLPGFLRNGRVYRSDDHGVSWVLVGQMPDGKGIDSVVVDPNDDNMLVVASGDYDHSRGVYRTPSGAGVSAAAYSFQPANSGPARLRCSRRGRQQDQPIRHLRRPPTTRG